MKKIDNFAKMLMILSVFIFCYACDSADDSNPNTNPTATTVTAENLNGYYVPYQDEIGDGTQNYRVVYFVKEDDGMNAYFDGIAGRRIIPLIVSDNKFTFDLNSDGAYVLNFSFSKDNAGKISLTNLNSGNTDYMIIHSEMFSSAQTPSWGGFSFEKSTGASGFFKYYRFSGTKTALGNGASPNPNPNIACYELANSIGFKSNSEILMGIFVPSWKGDTNIKMLLTHKNISTAAQYKYYN
ncbi:MAG: hypothetical protein RSD30_16435 [Flavobacterium sp.]